ncbi:Histamine H3 receptor [Daphnia magna]|uniref:Histamine H3 receptor n=1 Tax=Daphnia magna TaxID=35525 RepID=A0A164WNP0_9CRUS|nr:Histamine H3 receptor [Daphnia magna]
MSVTAVNMNWTTSSAPTLLYSSEEELNATLLYINSSSTITTYFNSSDVVATNALDSLMNVLIAMVLVILILTTAIGNVFVIAVILLERHLQSVANYLILSLAVADLLVACLVMPLGAVYQVTGKWLLGPELCDMWTSSDVLCCTASILHLVAIATDRYWAVTSIDYIQQRTIGRITVMIATVWLVSLLVSCFPLFGWKDDDWHKRIQIYQQCLISQDVGYQVFATLSTFYLPLAIILFLYWRIFLTAKKRIRRRKEPRQNNGVSSSAASGGLRLSLRGAVSSAAPTISTTNSTGISFVSTGTTCTAMTAAVGVLNLGRPSVDVENIYVVDEQTVDTPPTPPAKLTRRITSVAASTAASTSNNNRRRNMESKRERKAAKTLAIITGAFVFCWLPFFVIALLMPVCQWPHCYYDDNMVSFFLWLGYFNSTLNPILYTIFSPEFRNAFQKLLRISPPRQLAATSHSGGGMAASRAKETSRPNATMLTGATGGNNNKFNDPERQSVAAVSNYSG